MFLFVRSIVRWEAARPNYIMESRGFGGRGGIRTHGTLAGTPVFKTGALNHSATLPSLELSDLAGASVRGKHQLAVECRRWLRDRPCAPTRSASNHATPDGRDAAGLVERDREQTRAQQHKAGRRQREESVGYKVVTTHDTPTGLDARPNLLKLSEIDLFEKKCRLERTAAPFRAGQARVRKPSKACARKMAALNSPKQAVTVSIIAKILCAPSGRERHAALHSQKDSSARLKIEAD